MARAVNQVDQVRRACRPALFLCWDNTIILFYYANERAKKVLPKKKKKKAMTMSKRTRINCRIYLLVPVYTDRVEILKTTSSLCLVPALRASCPYTWIEVNWR
jgi:hypothetical protein